MSTYQYRRRSVAQAAAGLAAALPVVLSAGACSSRSSEDVAAEEEATLDEPIVLTDQRGKEHTFTKPIESIVTTVIPSPSMLAAIDQGYSRIKGVNESTVKRDKGSVVETMFPEAVSSRTVASSDFIPNVEEITSINPDVVIQWADQGDSATYIEPIKAAGYPVIGLTYEGYNAGMSSTKGYMNTWMTLCGATNIGADVDYSGTNATSVEQLVSWDPDIIYVSSMTALTPADIYADSSLSQLKAVRSKRIYAVPSGGFWWDPPSAESHLMMMWAAQVAYPDTAGYDLRSQIKENYELLYDYQLSEDEVDSVLRLEDNADAKGCEQFAR